jgi:alanine-glyoxylate transaminase/serine-glyoxylate transaminase/serine-pyruvate transaminase
VDEAAVRARLLKERSIEIGAGLGALRGEVWRVGLMGFSSTEANVLLIARALAEAVEAQGRSVDVAAGLGAASKALSA